MVCHNQDSELSDLSVVSGDELASKQGSLQDPGNSVSRSWDFVFPIPKVVEQFSITKAISNMFVPLLLQSCSKFFLRYLQRDILRWKARC